MILGVSDGRWSSMRKLPLGLQIWSQCYLNPHRRFIFEVGQQPSDAFEHAIASSLGTHWCHVRPFFLPEAKPYGAEPLAEKQIADAFAGFLFLVPGDIEDVHRLRSLAPDRFQPSQMDPCWSVVQLWPLWQGWVDE